MPELPEVETMRRGIRPIVGSRIERIERPRCRLKPIQITPRPAALRRRAVGCTIADVGRIGKRVVLHLDSDDALVFEPRMTGLLLLAAPPDEEHLRVRIGLSGKKARELLFWDRRGLGTMRLFTPQEYCEVLGPSRLGPDALLLIPGQLQEALHKSRRAIKVALLDQRAVAGIGNLYAAEILHVARIHPERSCSRLTKDQWRRLHEAIVHVLNDAIRYEGSTLADGTYRTALNQAGGYQNRHQVYSRAGKPCSGCGRDKIVRIVQAQRSTFYCPTCQPKRPRKEIGG